MQKTEYLDGSARNDEDRTVGLQFRYRLSRTLSLSLEGSKLWRTSTLASAEFTDRRVLFGVFYASAPLYAPTRK